MCIVHNIVHHMNLTFTFIMRLSTHFLYGMVWHKIRFNLLFVLWGKPLTPNEDEAILLCSMKSSYISDISMSFKLVCSTSGIAPTFLCYLHHIYIATFHL